MSRLDFLIAPVAIVVCVFVVAVHAARPSNARTVSSMAAPPANCSKEAIVYYASRAPNAFDASKGGRLYNVTTYTAATAVRQMPGFKSCALVVYAILKKAGCRWVRRTASAKSIYDMAYRHGWRPSNSPRGGCIVAWNSHAKGTLPRLGRGQHADPAGNPRVLYRHVGIMISRWWSIDNTSFLSRPTGGLAMRPFRYEAPIYLCPQSQR